jgi:23S rRNA pseudouridine2605 synthase
MEERIQKILARAGFGSRRACEELIAAGRVRVNGQVASLGDKADSQRDKILLDGKPVQAAEPFVYIALHKPRGVLSAVTSPDPRPTVLSLVDVPERVYPVGRLDADSEGLILLTNDGDLANRLTHPRYGHEKEYRVLVARRPDEQQLETWRRGVVLEDGFHTSLADVKMDVPAGKGAWLRVVMHEGRKRQIRETGNQIGLPVVRILRVRIGTLQLGNLKPREWRYLTPVEIALLKGKPGKTQLKPARAASKPKKTAHRPKKSGVTGRRDRRAPGNDRRK